MESPAWVVAPAARVVWYIMSSNSVDCCLYPTVLTLARFCATELIPALWALSPLAPEYNPCIMARTPC